MQQFLLKKCVWKCRLDSFVHFVPVPMCQHAFGWKSYIATIPSYVYTGLILDLLGGKPRISPVYTSTSTHYPQYLKCSDPSVCRYNAGTRPSSVPHVTFLACFDGIKVVIALFTQLKWKIIDCTAKPHWPMVHYNAILYDIVMRQWQPYYINQIIYSRRHYIPPPPPPPPPLKHELCSDLCEHFGEK